MIFKFINPEDRTKASLLVITKDEYVPELKPSCAVLLSANEIDFIAKAFQRAKEIVENKLITTPADEWIETDESLINYTLDWRNANKALIEFKEKQGESIKVESR